MAKYRKKPVVIEAEQFREHAIGAPPFYYDGNPVQLDELTHQYFIQTLESNRHVVSEGDWIIKGVKGEFYACKPDIFEMTYERVGEDH